MKIFFLSIFFFIALFINAQDYKTTIASFINNKELKTASLSLYAENLTTKSVVISYNPHLSLSPASVLKIMPTSMAFELLEPDTKFKTELSYSGNISKEGVLDGNIYIKGYGDPCLGSKNFDKFYNNNISLLQQWVDEVKRLNINKINGSVICDISYFGEITVPGKWLLEDIANYFASPASAISYMDNYYEIHFKTSSQDSGETEIIKIIPEDLNFKIKNSVKSSSTIWDEAYIFNSTPPYDFEVRGFLAWKQNDMIIKGALPSPALYLAKSFSNLLQSNSVQVKDSPILLTEKDSSLTTKVFYTTYSPSVSVIAEQTNLKSNNLYAETLAKHIEKKLNKPFTKAVKDFWSTKKIKLDDVYLDDACGLSRFNSISSKQIVDVLKYMRLQSKYGELFYNTLPISGVSGTLSRYCIGTAAQNKIHAKSGSMTRVRSYAGYFKNNKDEEIVFCFIANNYNCNNFKAKKLFEDLFVKLSELKE